MIQHHFETKVDKSIAACALHCQLFCETARKNTCASDNQNLGTTLYCCTTQTTYLVIEPEFFLIILLVIALHTHLFTIARTQPISSPSPLSFDAFRMRLLCPMRTALPQSIPKKDIAGIILRVTGRIRRSNSSGHREKLTSAKKTRFVRGGHRWMFSRTRVVVRARDATRRGRCRDRLVLRET